MMILNQDIIGEEATKKREAVEQNVRLLEGTT
jgi:hypothetical protein